MRCLTFLLPPVLAALCPSLLADEVRLSDGRVVVGATKTVGKYLHVKTVDGTLRIPHDEVVRVRTDAELRAELDSLATRAGSSSFARLQLARTARDFGLHDEMWELLDGVLAQSNGEAHEQSREFLAELEPVVLPVKWRKTNTETRVRELLHRIRPGTPAALHAAVEELLVREKASDAELRTRARTASRADRRLVALRALARRDTEGNDSFVYRAAILDREVEGRAAAARFLGGRDDTEKAILYLAPGLMHPSSAVRIRTAEAYGHMGDEVALELLVAAGPLAGTVAAGGEDDGSVRGHVAFLQQRSYIRDFNVEVAQASFIADPVVDVITSGTVLDADVHAVFTVRTEIVRAYRKSIRQIAGEDPGVDVDDWAEWLATRR